MLQCTIQRGGRREARRMMGIGILNQYLTGWRGKALAALHEARPRARTSPRLALALQGGGDLFETACMGVYVHGVAGDLAAAKLTEESMIASDLLEFIPEAMKEITA